MGVFVDNSTFGYWYYNQNDYNPGTPIDQMTHIYMPNLVTATTNPQGFAQAYLAAEQMAATNPHYFVNTPLDQIQGFSMTQINAAAALTSFADAGIPDSSLTSAQKTVSFANNTNPSLSTSSFANIFAPVGSAAYNAALNNANQTINDTGINLNAALDYLSNSGSTVGVNGNTGLSQSQINQGLMQNGYYNQPNSGSGFLSGLFAGIGGTSTALLILGAYLLLRK